MALVVGVVSAFFRMIFKPNIGPNDPSYYQWTFIFGVIPTIFIYYPYFVITAVKWGGGVGKLMLGQMIVDKDGGRISWREALLRYIVGFTVNTFTFGIGFLWAGFDKKKQGFHDKIAQTYVIRRPEGKSHKAKIGCLVVGLIFFFLLLILSFVAAAGEKKRKPSVPLPPTFPFQQEKSPFSHSPFQKKEVSPTRLLVPTSTPVSTIASAPKTEEFESASTVKQYLSKALEEAAKHNPNAHLFSIKSETTKATNGQSEEWDYWFRDADGEEGKELFIIIFKNGELNRGRCLAFCGFAKNADKGDISQKIVVDSGALFQTAWSQGANERAQFFTHKGTTFNLSYQSLPNEKRTEIVWQVEFNYEDKDGKMVSSFSVYLNPETGEVLDKTKVADLSDPRTF